MVDTAASAQDRIAQIRSGCWIGYDRALEAVAHMESLLLHPKRSRMPNLLIVGHTNNGKTMIAERVLKLHPLHLSEDKKKTIIPVLRVQMPPVPTSVRFYIALLKAMGAMDASTTFSGTIEHRQRITLSLLQMISVRLLIIDELHNILSANATRQREMLSLLRYIGNELHISLVCLGTQEAWLAIRSDEQLENRFEPFALPNWKNDIAFCRLLASYEAILPLQKSSNLTEPYLREEIFRRSDGLIGEVSAILEKAAVAAIESGEECITLELVKESGHLSPTERRRHYEAEIA